MQNIFTDFEQPTQKAFQYIHFLIKVLSQANYSLIKVLPQANYSLIKVLSQANYSLIKVLP